MIRYPDWRARLAAYVSEAARTLFRPGRHDCALFAAGAVEAMTGTDFARGHRGYRSLNEGRNSLKSKGFESMVDLAASVLPEVPPAFAQVGDVAVLEEDGLEAFGIVQGPMIYVLRLDGLGLVPLSRAKRAFRP